MRERLALLALTGAVLGLAVGLAVLFGRHRPAAAASLETSLPAPQTWTRLTAADKTKDVPVLAEFRALTLEPQAFETSGKSTIMTVELPVSTGDCAALEAKLGGSCGIASAPPAKPEKLAVQSLGAPLQGSMHLDESGTFELSQPGPGNSARPTEWTLVERAPKTILAITCNPGDRLLVANAMRSETTTCSLVGSTYSLAVTAVRRHPPRIHLNGVHSLHANLVGEVAETTVEEAKLILDGQEELVGPTEHARIAIQGKAGHRVHLKVTALDSGRPHLSMSTGLAATVDGAGYSLPTWMETHAEVSYLLIGALLGCFITYFFEFLVKLGLPAKWRRK